jgi:lipoate-protein ligase A
MTDGLVIDTSPLSVFEHMAFDELFALNCQNRFILRFYNWKENAVTFGYAQNGGYVVKNLPEKFKGCQITRRPTGGGVVFHAGDLTFSCILPGSKNFTPLAIYFKLHNALCQALCERKIDCRLSGSGSDAKNLALPICVKPYECFASPVDYDLLDMAGRKILGGAIRRFEGSILYQGSLQLEDLKVRFAEFKLSIMKALALSWKIKWQVHRLQKSFLNEVKDLAKNKYNSRQWIYKF